MESQNPRGKSPSVSNAPTKKAKAKNKASSSSHASGKMITHDFFKETNPHPNSSSSTAAIPTNPSAPMAPHSVVAKQENVYACKHCDKKFNNMQAVRGHQNAHKLERSMATQNPREVAHANHLGHSRVPPLNSRPVMPPQPPLLSSYNRSHQDLLNRAHPVHRPYNYQPMHQHRLHHGTQYMRPVIQSNLEPFIPRPPVPGSPQFQPGAYVVARAYPHLMPERYVPGGPIYFPSMGLTPHFPAMGNVIGNYRGRVVYDQGLPNSGGLRTAGMMINNQMTGTGTQQGTDSGLNLSLRL